MTCNGCEPDSFWHCTGSDEHDVKKTMSGGRRLKTKGHTGLNRLGCKNLEASTWSSSPNHREAMMSL